MIKGILPVVAEQPQAKAYPPPLVVGNTKLSNSVWHFSLPAIDTCTGKSGLCAKLCYALRISKRYRSVYAREILNEQMRHESNWCRRVISQITLNNIREVRIHVSGDFDTAKYASDWLHIVSRLPNVRFWAYTRSWSDPGILSVLDCLSRLPNMTLWHSCDKETGPPPRRKYCRRAYLAVDDFDVPAFKVDLVFRNYRWTKMVRVGGVMVCPSERLRLTSQVAEDGTKVEQKKVTCAQCKICFDKERIKWLDDFNSRSAIPVVEV